MWPEDIVPAIPGARDPLTPEEAIAGAELLPKSGSETADVYALADGGGEHLALVEPQAHNEENADGEWVEVDTALQPSASGWTWIDPSGNAYTFPLVLTGLTPVTVQTATGSMGVSPALEVLPLAEASPTPSPLPATEPTPTSSPLPVSEPTPTPSPLPVSEPTPTPSPLPSGSPGVVDGSTVTYPLAIDGHDITYTVSPTGVQEQIVIDEAPDEATFRFTIEADGLTLNPNDFGGLDVIDEGGSWVGYIPAPVAYDSSTDIASATATYEMEDLGGGTIELALAFDPSFFADATYPVIVDPIWNLQLSPSRDAYVDSAHASTSYESNIYLKVDSGKRTYVRFLMSSLTQADRLVYDATLFLYPTASGGVTNGIAAKRALGPLPAAGTLNWNNQPSIGSAPFDTTFAANNGQWWTWQLKQLFQHIIDPTSTWNANWDNDGIALTASNPKTFYATEAAGTADPFMYLTYNDLPNNPTLDTPAANYVTESESPTLKVTQIPGDPNGDEVLVSFQISDDGTNWTGSHLVFSSPYDDVRSFTVPAGVLVDGQDYWWRAVSWDICDPPLGFCTLTDGAGTQHTQNASGSRKITVSLRHLGDDPRYAMWSHDVGSGMTLKVNEANGNLFLDVPIDSYATPIGPLDVGLTYNHQATANYGLGPGWDVAIGPRSGHEGLPVALYKLDTTADADLKIRFRGGGVLYFPHVDKNIYGGTSGTSANSGWVRKGPANWTYVDGEGGRYTFSLGAENAEGAHLTKAKPSVSQDSAPDKSIDYTYNGSGQLTTVTEALGRKIVLTWGAGKLTQIAATGGTNATSFGGLNRAGFTGGSDL